MAVQDREAADQSRAKNTYYLAKCVLRSSVVLQAVYGHIRSPATLDVVFGKETSLELVVLSDDGVIQSVCEQPVFGTIKDLKVLPWNEHYRSSHPQTHGKDLLVVISDSGKVSFLTFCIELHRFLAVAHIHVSQPGNARRELGQLLAVESRGRAVAVGAFEDKIAIFPTASSAGNNIVEKRMIYPRETAIPAVGDESSLRKKGEQSLLWGTIWSLAFVPGTIDSKLAPSKDAANLGLAVLLNRKGATHNELLLLVCDPKERSIYLKARYNPSGPSTSGPLAYHVIDVPALPGFLLLLRFGDIVLLDVRNPGNPRSASTVPLIKAANAGKVREPRGPDGDEEGSCNVAASALLELVRRAEECGSDESSGEGSKGDLTAHGYKGAEPEGTPPSLVCAWSWESELCTQPTLVFGMDTGELFLAQLVQRDSDEINITLSDCLYKCSPFKSLLWTKDGFVAALVEMGDGHVIQIKDGKVSFRSLIQNIGPILDFALADYHNENQDQMFACSGVGHEGSLRVIRNGVNVEKLFSSPPVYKGVTGLWTMHIYRGDPYHAFLVISFVEETRVLSVGLNFIDITDSVGFDSSVCTLACGLIEDGWVVQVCSNEVRVCSPTVAAHPKGLNHSCPLSMCWRPSKSSVSLGAVAQRTVILAMSQPGLLLMLGLRTTSSGSRELFECQYCLLDAELSCISIPQEEEPLSIPVPPAIVGLVEASSQTTLPSGVEIGKVCVVGTRKPSVELLSIVQGERFRLLAVSQISLINTMGTSLSGCIPEDVRLVLFDRPYILTGLRNGMLLRFEWPVKVASPSYLFSSTIPVKGSQFHDNVLTLEASETSGLTSSGRDNISWEIPTFIQNRLGSGEFKQEGNDSSVPVQLHLIAVRRVGISPVSLVPLQGSLRADIIALSDRPWLLQPARHSQRIAYTSISFQPSTHATPVNCSECSKGILFVADCSLHLVEMEHSKRLNVQRLSLGSTSRKIVYHDESKMLLVMRSEYCELVSGCISDICCLDPLSGALLSSYKFEHGETPKCMQLWKFGNETLLLVGTGLTTGRAMMPNGEPESVKGRLLVFELAPKYALGNDMAFPNLSSSATGLGSPFSESSSHNSEPCLASDLDMATDDYGGDSLRFAEGEGWELTLKCQVTLSGVVLAVAPYLEQYILASAGNSLCILGFPSHSPHRLGRFDIVKTRFVITCIAVHLNRIAVGDCRDGILFYSYQEDLHKLEQLYCDPAQRLVADCVLMDLETALVTDRLGNFGSLSCSSLFEDSSSPERNLVLGCWYHMGEIIMSIRKGSFAYKVPVEASSKSSNKNNFRPSEFAESSVVASTLLGSVVIFIKITREEYELLEAVQTRLALYPLTAPLLGNNHALFRGRGCPAGVCKVLDGDMLEQFLELTNMQQQSVLADQPGLGLESLSSFSLTLSTPSHGSLPVEQVLRLLERVHNSLT